MPPLIMIQNHGPLIVATNYWASELVVAEKVFASVNAGAIRLLLPPARYGDLESMRPAKYCVLSRGPWAESRGREPVLRIVDAVEILFEDLTDAPYSMQLSHTSFDLLPGEPTPGREWVLTVWLQKDGRPHKSLERLCHWRRVPKLPWLKPWP